MTAVSESDIEAGECQASPPSSLPIIRQTGASSAIDDVTAYVDAVGMATTPAATHGDDMGEDAIQVAVNAIWSYRELKFRLPLWSSSLLLWCSIKYRIQWLSLIHI